MELQSRIWRDFDEELWALKATKYLPRSSQSAVLWKKRIIPKAMDKVKYR